MRKFNKLILLMAILLALLSACGGSGGGDDVDNPGATENPEAPQETATAFEEIDGNTYTYTLPGGTVFKAILTPDIATSNTFPTGTDDAGSANVPARFIMGETEVTYELWKEVYDWATSTDRGVDKYEFADAGIMGDGEGDTNQHPVTVLFYSTIVWCNALTEYYNANNGSATDLECVYTYDNVIIRDSRYSNETACDGAVQSTTAKGFRLPTSNEWEFAARYRGADATNTVSGYSNPYYTKGNSASGDTQAFDVVTPTLGDYAVHSANSELSTAEVKTKKANALGLYDMSGNVYEWCFDLHPDFFRVIRGGYYDDNPFMMQIGIEDQIYFWIGRLDGKFGFRFCRTQ